MFPATRFSTLLALLRITPRWLRDTIVPTVQSCSGATINPCDIAGDYKIIADILSPRAESQINNLYRCPVLFSTVAKRWKKLWRFIVAASPMCLQIRRDTSESRRSSLDKELGANRLDDRKWRGYTVDRGEWRGICIIERLTRRTTRRKLQSWLACIMKKLERHYTRHGRLKVPGTYHQVRHLRDDPEMLLRWRAVLKLGKFDRGLSRSLCG